MSRRRDDEWDDDDRGEPRRRRDEYDDYDDYDDRGRGPQRSGAITACGVVSIVLGGIFFIFSFCLLLGGAVTSDAAVFEASGVLRFLSTMALINGIVFLALGGCGITAGIGLLMRKRWGKVLGLIAAGLAILAAVLEVVRLLGGFMRLPAGFGVRGAGIAVLIVDVLFLLAYAVVSFVILFNSKATRELR